MYLGRKQVKVTGIKNPTICNSILIYVFDFPKICRQERKKKYYTVIL